MGLRDTLILGDCLEEMARIPDGSVDMVLCDLPYGTTACKWDTIVSLDALWAHYRRIVKADGAIVLTASQPFTTALIASNMADFRYEWVWEKPQGTNPMSARSMPLKAHENILIFYSRQPTYNPEMGHGTPKRAGCWPRPVGDAYHASASYRHDNPTGTRYPKTVLRFGQERGLHPTQKPVALFAYLIRTYTNPGDTVLDNCIGSGTTAVACIQEGRHYIGIERDPTYYAIAQQRIAAVQPHLITA